MRDDGADDAAEPGDTPVVPSGEAAQEAPLGRAKEHALGAESVRGVNASRERRAALGRDHDAAGRDRMLDVVNAASEDGTCDDSTWSEELASRQATGAMRPAVPPPDDQSTPADEPARRVFGLLHGMGSVGPEFFDALPEDELRLWHALPLVTSDRHLPY